MDGANLETRVGVYDDGFPLFEESPWRICGEK
ncbi:hypothetical protein K227x_13130 [Rubripirellula lacrimiformis]|uniref:Uncharacterized protein n=1 Tax=Rubripirellula lacrimiformis TaxID=1930273 RepID=A0A517N709_9BACT|nr:hypothetical protein K227x_13130 [Rubripirellula lacrimiformis]